MSTMSAASISFFLVALTVVNDYVFVLTLKLRVWTGLGEGVVGDSSYREPGESSEHESQPGRRASDWPDSDQGAL